MIARIVSIICGLVVIGIIGSVLLLPIPIQPTIGLCTLAIILTVVDKP